MGVNTRCPAPRRFRERLRLRKGAGEIPVAGLAGRLGGLAWGRPPGEQPLADFRGLASIPLPEQRSEDSGVESSVEKAEGEGTFAVGAGLGFVGLLGPFDDGRPLGAAGELLILRA